MKPALIIKQYTWLVNLLLQNGPMTLREISDRWQADQMAEGNPLPRSTFNRHRDAILDMFGVIIDCNPSDGYRYRISNPEVLKDGTIERWLLSRLTVGNVLADSVQVQDRILLENVPSGEHYLAAIISAIKTGRRIMLRYRRFGSANDHEVSLKPYALKFFERRWYLLAKSTHHLATYSLDRITGIKITNEPFKMPTGFSPAKYYGDYYGVFTLDLIPCQHVELRAYGTQASYMRTLPMHPTQRQVAEGDGYTDFALDLRPTPDFVKAIVAESPKLQVLKPESLRQQVIEMLNSALLRYK